LFFKQNSIYLLEHKNGANIKMNKYIKQKKDNHNN
jgi:hypothetical protein